MNELAERGETKNYSFSVLTKILKPGGWDCLMGGVEAA
jgi:hypothetical protein